MDFLILGPLEVYANGRPVELGGPKQRALLAALLMRAGEVVSADRLLEELWAGSDPDKARKALQVRLSQLRKLLAAAAGGRELILTRPTGYVIATEADELDLARFERLSKEGRAALESGEPGVASARLGEALALWRGAPLADLTFEPFAQSELARLEEARLAALEDRYAADLELGRHAELVGEIEALAASHPLRERLRGQLMLALYRCGRQADALAVHRAGRQLLVEELGIEPGRALKELEQAILLQDPALDQTRQPAGTNFVGRARELGLLTEAMKLAARGDGRLVLIGGEPGAGKSRLADELARRATVFEVHWGRCWEAGGAPAFWPWVQVLRGCVSGSDPDDTRRRLGRGAPEVAQLVPELHDMLGELPAPPDQDSEGARFRLFDAVTEFLARASADRALILVIDDLHAADPSSLLLLELLGARLAGMRVLVVGAYRSTEAVGDHPLVSTLAQLAREPTVDRIELTGLSEDEVSAYLGMSAGGEAPQSLVAAVHHATSGNPLFVRELTRLLSEEGAFERGPQEALPIPAGVREVIERRIAPLSEPCRRALTMASVLGREFNVQLLAGLADLDPPALLQLMDEVRAAGLVSDVSGTAGRLRFSHELVRDAVYDSLGAAARIQLHGRAGDLLVESHRAHLEPHLAEVAHHYIEAVPGGERERAVTFAQRAGRRAVRLHAYEEAVRLFGAARHVLDDAGAVDPVAYCDLLLELGDAAARSGQGDSARQTFVEAADIARDLQDPTRFARAALGYGGRLVWLRSLGDDRLIDLLEEALDGLPGDHALRVGLLARLSGALRDRAGREDDRDRLSAEAVQIAERLDDPALLAHAFDGRYAAIWRPDNPEERAELARAFIRTAHAARDRERVHHGYLGLVISHLDLGEMRSAAAGVREMARIAQELRQPGQLWLTAGGESLLAVVAGRLDDAEALMEAAYQYGRHGLNAEATFARAVQLALLRREQGRAEETLPELMRCVERFGSSRPVCVAVLGYLYAGLGRLGEAAEVLDHMASDDFARFTFDNEWLVSMYFLAEVAAAVEDQERMQGLYGRLLPYAQRNAVDFHEVYLGSVSRALGILAAGLGRTVEADRHFDDAIEMNTRTGSKLALAATHASRAGPPVSERI